MGADVIHRGSLHSLLRALAINIVLLDRGGTACEAVALPNVPDLLAHSSILSLSLATKTLVLTVLVKEPRKGASALQPRRQIIRLSLPTRDLAVVAVARSETPVVPLRSRVCPLLVNDRVDKKTRSTATVKKLSVIIKVTIEKHPEKISPNTGSLFTH